MMKAKDQIIARMYVVLTALVALPILIASQLLGIHFRDGQGLRDAGEKQASAAELIPAVRGSVYDSAGRTLVANTARFDLVLDPMVAGFEARKGEFLTTLARLTNVSASHYRNKVKHRTSPQYVLLRRDLSEDVKEQIEKDKFPGIRFEPTFSRRYNHGTTLAHVLGHVNSDGTGMAGIEKQYDAELTGTAGRRVQKKDRKGRTTAYVGGHEEPPVHGNSVVLTVDLVQQAIAEEELARGVQESGSTWGILVAMKPSTGEILALASYPTYDPNATASFSAAQRRNHVISDQIEPGSTFKLVSAVASIEEGVVSLSDSIETGNGHAVFGGRSMHDTHAHGTISYLEAIAVSSNIGIAKTARKLKPNKLYQHARNLGFGQQTWIDLPGEVAGLLKKTNSWSGTSKTSISIGYEVDATPMQLLAAYGALANDGLLVQPYIVKERRDFGGKTIWKARTDSVRRAFKKKTATRLIPAFEEVVKNGTAQEAAIEGLAIAGKTGTAHKVGENGYNTSLSRASFAGFFPAHDPQVVMLVIMDEPEKSKYGGVVSAPVFRRVAERWIPTMPDASEFFNDFATLDESGADKGIRTASSTVPTQTVPPVVGQPLAVARNGLVASGFDVRDKSPTPSRAIVRKQTPTAGEATEGRRLVKLVSDVVESQDGKTMPDLKGLSVRQARYWLATKNIDVTIEGHGTVTKQYPAAGQPVTRQAKLVCR